MSRGKVAGCTKLTAKVAKLDEFMPDDVLWGRNGKNRESFGKSLGDSKEEGATGDRKPLPVSK